MLTWSFLHFCQILLILSNFIQTSWAIQETILPFSENFLFHNQTDNSLVIQYLRKWSASGYCCQGVSCDRTISIGFHYVLFQFRIIQAGRLPLLIQIGWKTGAIVSAKCFSCRVRINCLILLESVTCLHRLLWDITRFHRLSHSHLIW